MDEKITNAARRKRQRLLAESLHALCPGETLTLPAWVDKAAVYRALSGAGLHTLDVNHGVEDGRLVVKRHETVKPAKASPNSFRAKLRHGIAALAVGEGFVFKFHRSPDEAHGIAARIGYDVTIQLARQGWRITRLR